ncbi:MAG: hypothetical protein R3F43_04935 [bacterium]
MLTTQESFARLDAALRPTSADDELVARLGQSLETRIGHHLPGFRGLHPAGAYSRGAAPRPPDPVDLLVEVDAPLGADGRPAVPAHPLLARLALLVGGTTRPPRRRCRQAVDVRFPDWNLGFHLLPAVQGAEAWWIPDSQGGWLRTQPQQHRDDLVSADHAAGGRLLPLLRILRWWRRARDAAGESLPCGGFHLETMASEPFRQWFPQPAPTSLPEGLAEIFAQLARRVHGPCSDSTRAGPRLDDTLALDTRLHAADQLAEAARIARAAVAADRAGELEQAHLRWRVLLGPIYTFNR